MLALLDAQLRVVEQSLLPDAVRRALGDGRARILDWHVQPVGYVKLNPASEGLYHVTGTAVSASGCEGMAWRMIFSWPAVALCMAGMYGRHVWQDGRAFGWTSHTQ